MVVEAQATRETLMVIPPTTIANRGELDLKLSRFLGPLFAVKLHFRRRA